MREGWTAKGIRKKLESMGVRKGAVLRLKKYINVESRETVGRMYKVTVVNVFPHVIQLENEYGFMETPGDYTLLAKLLDAKGMY